MTAPEEFSRKRNTVSGETAAAITHRNPTTEDAGSPTREPRFLLTVIRPIGASRRAASTNSIRDEV